MEKAERLKSNYKIFLLVLKYLPYLVALLDVIDTFSSFYYKDLVWLSYIGGTSFLTILFMLITSFTFKFCTYHRLPIYYIVLNNCLNTYDYYLGIPVSNENLLLIHSILLFIAIVIFTILHIKKI